MKEVLIFHLNFPEGDEPDFNKRFFKLMNDGVIDCLRHSLVAVVKIEDKVDAEIKHYLYEALSKTTSRDGSWEWNEGAYSYVDDPRDSTEGDIFYIQGSFFILKGTGFWPINARIKEVK